MGTSSKERQYFYRLKHPQINVTFRDRDEDWVVRRALIRTRLTPRKVLLNWARQVLEQPNLQEDTGKPNAVPVTDTV
jgi:hypothetical protein